MALGLLAVVLSAAVLVRAPEGVAEGSVTAATARVQRAGASLGQDGNAPVVRVNGQSISKRTLAIHTATAELLGLDGKSEAELLQGLVDDALLTQAAIEAGVVVKDTEVDDAIRAGLTDPLDSDDYPRDLKDLSLAILALHGVTPESAIHDPELRSAYRGLILRGRFVLASGVPRNELLLRLRTAATVEVLLPAPTAKQ